MIYSSIYKDFNLNKMSYISIENSSKSSETKRQLFINYGKKNL